MSAMSATCWNAPAADVGGETIFTKADVFLFCSATMSRKVMEADPMNLQYCPYSIFVVETPRRAGQDHRRPPHLSRRPDERGRGASVGHRGRGADAGLTLYAHAGSHLITVNLVEMERARGLVRARSSSSPDIGPRRISPVIRRAAPAFPPCCRRQATRYTRETTQ